MDTGRPSDASEPWLEEFFAARGLAVTHVSLVVDRATGRSRGFGFVEFDRAAEAVLSLENAEVGGRRLIIRRVEERRASSR